MGDISMTRALVLTILRHAEDYPWRMQEIGLMGLRLDDRREYRLHVWDPSLMAGEPPVHDHPYDFTSTVVVGELTNTRYVEDPAGEEYIRYRYSPPDESGRRADTVRLSAVATVLREGDEYGQVASELHASDQIPGTVSLIRCRWGETGDLTVCIRDQGSWSSGQSRPATHSEIKSMAAKALERF